MRIVNAPIISYWKKGSAELPSGENISRRTELCVEPSIFSFCCRYSTQRNEEISANTGTVKYISLQI